MSDAKPLRVPVSSYAQLKARRKYYRRNRAVCLLGDKLRRAGIPTSTQALREEITRVYRGEP